MQNLKKKGKLDLPGEQGTCQAMAEVFVNETSLRSPTKLFSTRTRSQRQKNILLRFQFWMLRRLGLGKKEDDNVKSDEKKEIILELKYLKEMIERTILSYHNYKVMDILTSNDLNISIQYLEKIYQNLEVIESDVYLKSTLEILEEINLIKGELSSIFRNYGTHNIHDLLEVTFGKNYMKNILISSFFLI